MLQKAIAEYHRMLAADEALGPEFLARLKERMRDRHLLYGDRELGVALRPHFLTRNQYDRLAQASGVLAGAYDKLAAALLADASLMDSIGLRDKERRLALVHPGYSSPAVNTRLDAFLHGDEVRFVEYNAENPSSLTDQPGLNDVLFEIQALQSFAERYRISQFTPVESLRRALLLTYRDWGGLDMPSVAIVDWADLPTESEFILIRNYFVGRGVPTIICTPDELEYTGGRLHRGDFRIDLVYKRVIIDEFLDRYDETHPMLQAYINHDVCVINPFRSKMLHKKASFGLLTEDAHQTWFTPLEREVIRCCVPWTRRVTERKTSYRDQSIDLIEHVRKKRADFVLKPNDDYGGRGIFFGKSSTPSQWEEALSTALAGDYVVQEMIDLQPEEFPVFTDQEWRLQPMLVDTNPFIFRGEVEGALVRLSDSPIVNVTSGGGETGFFILEGEV